MMIMMMKITKYHASKLIRRVDPPPPSGNVQKKRFLGRIIIHDSPNYPTQAFTVWRTLTTPM